ncbi:probable phospholipid-transporting ATPase IF isoform X3 [Pomacea canaliculata]|uniref:probable phospholipid-transporting ATPase IF isoform X3 n=1 Tax=Pomacea canaliculata TaxID=400727 RepID=UPI000D7290B0|nr:probable phospholipid-transporting ATPase IF isoform X3 [Pomacea canaliculata]
MVYKEAALVTNLYFIWQKCMKHEQPEIRTIHVGHNVCSSITGEEVYIPHKYPHNRVVSSQYTLLTFLPKNLFSQFRRIANFYFLVVGIIQLIIDTPVTPIATILPLTFVITVTAIKQGYEDWLRHKADKEINYRNATVVEKGHLKDCRSMDIKVGDIVRVQINEKFPCDLVMLSSNNQDGKCYVTTANLDGETNLKTQVCIPETRKYRLDTDFEGLEAVIECEKPVADLYRFIGRLHIMQNGQKITRPLSLENILLQGARLRNTTFIYGCAVYTGQETKMGLNSKFKTTKFSHVERRMNTFLIVFIITLFLLSSIFTGLKYWYTTTFILPWYVPPGKDELTTMNVIEDFLAFTVLYYYIIPISLYVTIEIQRVVGSMFFKWDCSMYDDELDHPAQANTSDLNEELGQVEYLFADKTGTLTENTMQLRFCSINGIIYEEINDTLCEYNSSQPVSNMSEHLIEFFTVLVLCHTVRVDHKTSGDTVVSTDSIYSHSGKDYEYNASSPDEKALVEACRKYGIVFHGSRNDHMEVTFQDTMKRFKVLNILEFDSIRRCMSVIVQDETGEIHVLCKGAEIDIFEKVSSGDLQSASKHINQFAKLGLRTLAIAKKTISRIEFETLNGALLEAKSCLQRREKKVLEVCNMVESELKLLGVTAVEDKLQKDVPETIIKLRNAGIKVWVLTGDKEETAINISYSTGHFNMGMKELHLTGNVTSDDCQIAITRLCQTITLSDDGDEYVLIIDGQSLHHVLANHQPALRQLCSSCVAVLCCRMSPIQKAQVVRFVKHLAGAPVTAAIGDGANDVSMIHEAHVGIGIMGKEGRMAVTNSDYAFGKFRFLSRALLLHGHLYYIRLATVVQYSFYKNVAFITPQVFYQFFCHFSQQSAYDSFYLLFYNITCTSLPILIYGMFEQHMLQSKLLGKPAYTSLWHGVVCFFGVYLLFYDDITLKPSGKMLDLFSFGTVINVALIFVVNLKLALFTHFWAWPMFGAYAFSFVGNMSLSFLVSSVTWGSWATNSNSFFGVLEEVMGTGMIWLGLLVIICIALLPDLLVRIYQDIRNHQTVYRPDLYRPPGDRLIISFTKRSGTLTISQEALVASPSPTTSESPCVLELRVFCSSSFITRQLI